MQERWKLESVVRLEWRRRTNPGVAGMVSHSMLDAHLFSGSYFRFERYQEGLVWSRFDDTVAPPTVSTLYWGRVAGQGEFATSFRLMDLEEAAEELCQKQYSTFHNNCHHLVRDLWNLFVSKPLRCNHYPDRIKIDVLCSFTEPVSTLSSASRRRSLPSDVGRRCPKAITDFDEDQRREFVTVAAPEKGAHFDWPLSRDEQKRRMMSVCNRGLQAIGSQVPSGESGPQAGRLLDWPLSRDETASHIMSLYTKGLQASGSPRIAHRDSSTSSTHWIEGAHSSARKPRVSDASTAVGSRRLSDASTVAVSRRLSDISTVVAEWEREAACADSPAGEHPHREDELLGQAETPEPPRRRRRWGWRPRAEPPGAGFVELGVRAGAGDGDDEPAVPAVPGSVEVEVRVGALDLEEDEPDVPGERTLAEAESIELEVRFNEAEDSEDADEDGFPAVPGERTDAEVGDFEQLLISEEFIDGTNVVVIQDQRADAYASIDDMSSVTIKEVASGCPMAKAESAEDQSKKSASLVLSEGGDAWVGSAAVIYKGAHVDWPLSRDETKCRIMSLQDRRLHAVGSGMPWGEPASHTHRDSLAHQKEGKLGSQPKPRLPDASTELEHEPTLSDEQPAMLSAEVHAGPTGEYKHKTAECLRQAKSTKLAAQSLALRVLLPASPSFQSICADLVAKLRSALTAQPRSLFAVLAVVLEALLWVRRLRQRSIARK